jgi:hypothetical protein
MLQYSCLVSGCQSFSRQSVLPLTGWYQWAGSVVVCNLDVLDKSRDEREFPGQASYMIGLGAMQCGISLLADRENGPMVFVALR